MKAGLFLRRLLARSLVLLFFFGSGVVVKAQVDLPAWALYQRGLEYLPSPDDVISQSGENDPGEALRFFRRAIERREAELAARGEEPATDASRFPEAEAGLARVYLIEGNLTLAERHYLRALDSSAFLSIPETELALRYELAEVYEMSQQRRLAQQQWLTVVEDVDAIGSAATREVLDNYQRIFWEEGTDRLLQLYRQEGTASIAANQNLGRQFLGMGRYQAAFDHDIMATVKIVTVVMEEIRLFRPLYQFETLDQMLAVAGEYSGIESYLAASGLFDTLERLAQASFRLRGGSARSRELWQLVATHAPRGSVAGSKARRRIGTPETDPLIVPR